MSIDPGVYNKGRHKNQVFVTAHKGGGERCHEHGACEVGREADQVLAKCAQGLGVQPLRQAFRNQQKLDHWAGIGTTDSWNI